MCGARTTLAAPFTRRTAARSHISFYPLFAVAVLALGSFSVSVERCATRTLPSWVSRLTPHFHRWRLPLDGHSSTVFLSFSLHWTAAYAAPTPGDDANTTLTRRAFLQLHGHTATACCGFAREHLCPHLVLPPAATFRIFLRLVILRYSRRAHVAFRVNRYASFAILLRRGRAALFAVYCMRHVFYYSTSVAIFFSLLYSARLRAVGIHRLYSDANFCLRGFSNI